MFVSPEEYAAEEARIAALNEAEAKFTEVTEPEETEKTTEVALGAEPVEEASESTEEQDSESTEEQEEQEVEQPKPKISGYEKRVKKLNQKAEEARREAEYWKAEALKNTQSTSTPTAQVAQPNLNKPTQAQYGFDTEAYTDALLEWKLAQREIQQKQIQEQEAVKQKNQTWQSRLAEYESKHPGTIDKISDPDLKPSPEVNAALLDSEVGPAMADYLAENTDELDRINSLSPHRRLIEMGKLEDRFLKPKKEAPKAKASPAPISKTKGATPVPVQKDITKMSSQEFIKYRNAMELAKLKAKR